MYNMCIINLKKKLFHTFVLATRHSWAELELNKTMRNFCQKK